MPHQCTTCGQVFEDGSKEMLGGCPECGNNTFQFHAGDPPEEPTDSAPPDPAGSRVGRAADTVREFVSDPDWPGDRGAATRPGDVSGEPGDSDIIEAPSEVDDGPEDRAQADARTAVVDRDDVVDDPDSSATDAVAEDAVDDSDGDSPDGAGSGGTDTDLAALRDELDDQFESIRIVEPGQYELNLMELYNREEYIVALQEDGRYVIEVPGDWRDDAGPPGDGN